MMSQTMSPLGVHQTSNRTIGLGSSAEELPHIMARTFMSSSADSIVNEADQTSPRKREGKRKEKHTAVVNLNQTQVNFSDKGSELRGWE